MVTTTIFLDSVRPKIKNNNTNSAANFSRGIAS